MMMSSTWTNKEAFPLIVEKLQKFHDVRRLKIKTRQRNFKKLYGDASKPNVERQ